MSTSLNMTEIPTYLRASGSLLCRPLHQSDLDFLMTFSTPEFAPQPSMATVKATKEYEGLALPKLEKGRCLLAKSTPSFILGGVKRSRSAVCGHRLSNNTVVRELPSPSKRTHLDPDEKLVLWGIDETPRHTLRPLQPKKSSLVIESGSANSAVVVNLCQESNQQNSVCRPTRQFPRTKSCAAMA
jgi:hypothetical protein